MTSWVDATFYAQVEPDWSGYASTSTGERALVGAKVKRITQARPERPAGGTVLVKLTLRLPDSAFRPLRPEAVVVVPESSTLATPVQVVAEHPGELDEDVVEAGIIDDDETS